MKPGYRHEVRSRADTPSSKAMDALTELWSLEDAVDFMDLVRIREHPSHPRLCFEYPWPMFPQKIEIYAYETYTDGIAG